MASPNHLQHFIDGAHIAPEVSKLRPDYRVLLMAVDGISSGPSNDDSESIMRQAEAAAREALALHPVTEIPHVAAWREAYKAFGAKPQRTRNSLEALLRRVGDGGETMMPRVNRLTDVYNAISIKHQIPLGGEDLSNYESAPRLVRATGKEDFEVISSGATVVEHPDVGEVVWCDDAGVTCRRWNWRQCQRTALTEGTTTALFIFDVLQPVSDEALNAAADELVEALRRFDPNVSVVRRVISASSE